MTGNAVPGANDKLSVLVPTLVANGFEPQQVHRRPRYVEIECARSDEFGARIRYVVALADEPVSDPDATSLRRLADRNNAQLIIIGSGPGGIVAVPWDTFIARMGGPVKVWAPLEPDFADLLDTLGHNTPVAGLVGKPDDLFEEYVHVGLQFLLGARVVRYGQDRRGEVVPDGAGFLGMAAPLFLYDAKAYRDCYEVDRTSIRQFADYVTDFHQRYEHHVGRVHSFVVVSACFRNNAESREERSRELHAECQVPLAFLEARQLGEACSLLASSPAFRTALDWRRIFARTNVASAAIAGALAAAQRDGLVR